MAGWRGAGSQALRLFRWDLIRRASRIRRTDRHPRVQSSSCGQEGDDRGYGTPVPSYWYFAMSSRTAGTGARGTFMTVSSGSADLDEDNPFTEYLKHHQELVRVG